MRGVNGIECGKRIELPVQSRNARRVAERLKPVECGEEYVLIVCRGLECRKCVFEEEPSIIVGKTWVNDPLSGLRSRLPVVEARYKGRVIWRAVWRRGMLVVDRIEC